MKTTFWKKHHPWMSSLRTRLVLSFALFLGVLFIILFIKPFDLGEKQLPNKHFILSGFACCVLLADLTMVLAERFLVLRKKYFWKRYWEGGYFLLLFFLVGFANFSYDKIFLKNTAPLYSELPAYLLEFTLPFACLFFPIIAYFRYQYGTIVHPEKLALKPIILEGQNKGEQLELFKRQILYVQAEDNYIRIYFKDEDDVLKNRLMRNTLSNCAAQIPELSKCHRSYLVAPWSNMQLKGSRHKAQLRLEELNIKIPVSATYYDVVLDLF